MSNMWRRHMLKIHFARTHHNQDLRDGKHRKRVYQYRQLLGYFFILRIYHYFLIVIFVLFIPSLNKRNIFLQSVVAFWINENPFHLATLVYIDLYNLMLNFISKKLCIQRKKSKCVVKSWILSLKIQRFAKVVQISYL